MTTRSKQRLQKYTLRNILSQLEMLRTNNQKDSLMYKELNEALQEKILNDEKAMQEYIKFRTIV